MTPAVWAIWGYLAILIVAGCAAKALWEDRDYWKRRDEDARRRLRDARTDLAGARRELDEARCCEASSVDCFAGPPPLELDEAYTPEERDEHQVLFEQIVAPYAEEARTWTT